MLREILDLAFGTARSRATEDHREAAYVFAEERAASFIGR
jgi:hypothetical protein